MTSADVETVKAAIAAVRSQMDPDELVRIRGVRFTAKPRPDAKDLKLGCFPGQKAAYYGVACELGVQGAPELPSPEPATGEITLFLDNLAPVTPERARVAVLHEVMHALGYDEETIWAMGLYLEEGPPCTPF